MNAFVIRKERKPSGRGRLIEGTLSDMPIVLVDDIINSGRSAERARVVLDRSGHTITTVFDVIDFGATRGRAWRAEHGIGVETCSHCVTSA